MAKHPKRAPRQKFNPMIVLVLGGAAVIVAAAAVLALRPVFTTHPTPSASSTSAGVVISMGGFSPDHIMLPAGRPITLTLTNPDSQFHTDGGGWHQFAIDALQLDVRIPPHSEKTVTLPTLAPGTYEFYCDICCGGRSNPSMRGVLEITG